MMKKKKNAGENANVNREFKNSVGKKAWDSSSEKTKTVRKLNPEEFIDFIKESLENRKASYKRVIIGTINEIAQKRIEKKFKYKVKEIDIDNYSIIHAVTQMRHNLEPEDLFLAIDVINSSTDIELSDAKHQDNDVLIFQKDIDGEITFLTEVRVKNGYLLVFDAWRQRKARSRRSSDATKKSPRTYAQSDSPRDGLSIVSPESGEKSSDFAI